MGKSVNLKNLKGKQFGRLIVVEQDGWYITPCTNGRTALWKCLCSCGNYKTVRSNHLTGGTTMSCGCLRRTHRLIDLSGKVYGKLSVVSFAGTDRYGAWWHCECSCGKRLNVSSRSLKHVEKLSCGCAKKNELYRSDRALYAKCRMSAMNRSMPFELTIEQVASLSRSACFYCGRLDGDHNGIDRMDSSYGYVLSNCTPCCWICNRAKAADLSSGEFIAWASDIYRTQNK